MKPKDLFNGMTPDPQGSPDKQETSEARRMLEDKVIDQYISGEMSIAEVGRALGFDNPWATRDFLSKRQIPLNYSSEDLQDDLEVVNKFPRR